MLNELSTKKAIKEEFNGNSFKVGIGDINRIF
jgi:hypothetical protein